MPPTYRLTPFFHTICYIHTVCEIHLVRIYNQPGGRQTVEARRMFELAQALAVAKSRQDLPAAMQLFDPDMLLETPAFGTRASGLAENEAALARFFRSFPDYDVVLHGHASDGK